MKELYALHDLVEDEPVVDVLQDLLPDRIVQVGFHELEHQVQILIVVRFDHIMQFYNIGVVELVQEHDFPEGTLRIRGMLESIEDLLKRHCLLGFPVGHFPDVPVGPAAQFLY